MSKTPSIAVIPSGYKGAVSGANGTVYSVLPTNGDADLDFTRNCVATRVNQNGLLEEVGLNVPRLDYSDGGCPSLLLEPTRTNYVIYSVLGVPTSGVDMTNKVVSPSGLVDASKPIPSSTGSRFEYNFAPSTLATDDIVTYSWYRKRISTPIDDVYLGDLTFQSLINLEKVGVTEQIESDINGFDRFQASAKVIDGSIESKFRAYFGSIIGVGNQSVAYYGHQLELGSYATSLIYTSGTEVTRLQDEASKNNLESYINSSEGVLYLETKFLTDNTNGFYRISLAFDSSSNVVRFTYVPISSQIRAEVIVGGSTQFIQSVTSLNITTYLKIAIKYKENDFSLWIDGTKLGSSNVGSIFSNGTLNELAFSSGSNGNPYSGKIKDLRVYNEALTDEELITLTQ